MHHPKINLLVALLRGILADRAVRRQWMGWLTACLVALFFIGAVPAAGWLDGHPWIFICYWLAVAWLLLTVVLLALYDLLLVWAAARKEQRALRRNLRGEPPQGADDGG